MPPVQKETITGFSIIWDNTTLQKVVPMQNSILSIVAIQESYNYLIKVWYVCMRFPGAILNVLKVSILEKHG